MGAYAVVHASNGITLGTADIYLDPTATFDHMSVNLEGSAITFSTTHAFLRQPWPFHHALSVAGSH